MVTQCDRSGDSVGRTSRHSWPKDVIKFDVHGNTVGPTK